MQRISVVGTSGSGKSTVSRRLADALGMPHVELDALHWGPDWVAATAEDLQQLVAEATRGDAWVVDGNYESKLGRLVWDRADTVVWVDPPRWLVMWRSLTRVLGRILTREELWGSNRESWRALMFWRGEESILWWAWTTYPQNRRRYLAAMDDPANAHLTFHRLRTTAEVERFLAGVDRDTTGRRSER